MAAAADHHDRGGSGARHSHAHVTAGTDTRRLALALGLVAEIVVGIAVHSVGSLTYDRYGHLMPGNEGEAAALLDAYRERATSRTTA